LDQHLLFGTEYFGTFQAEEEQTVYNINQFIKPITLNFCEWKDIVFRKNVITRSLYDAIYKSFKLETVKAILFKEILNSKRTDNFIKMTILKMKETAPFSQSWNKKLIQTIRP
jgi:hypothetical protein